MSKYPSVICYDCGEKHGRRIPSIATWYPETCDVCGEKTDCTQPRDFGHLKPGWEQEAKKESK